MSPTVKQKTVLSHIIKLSAGMIHEYVVKITSNLIQNGNRDHVCRN